MKPDAAKAAHEAIIDASINFVACLPDSAFKELYDPLSSDSRVQYVQVANESDGVGICMGAWLGGLKPALLMENTGFSLGCYALLRGPIAFGVPIMLLISHRGGIGDERWFSVPFGWATESLLAGLRISYRFVDKTEDIHDSVVGAAKSMNSLQAPVGIVFSSRLLF